MGKLEASLGYIMEPVLWGGALVFVSREELY